MRLLLRLSVVALFAALAFPGGASAEVNSLVFQSAPIKVDRYAVARGVQLAPSPSTDGYVVGLKADLVDLQGNLVSGSDVMLHHVVFAKLGAADATCSSFADYDDETSPLATQRFYAEGEEHFSLQLPDGYGYPNRATDQWGLLYMLMNHHARPSTVRVRYTVTYVTGEARTAVTPIWLDVRNCRADPIFNVPGTGGPGSTYAQHADWVVPQSGVLVAGGAHLHGGGISVDVSDTSCGSIFTSYPVWGGTEPRPVLHEPGPIAMTGFSDPAGRPVRARDTLRITATYDDSRPHVRVMGIAIVYFAPRPETSCGSFFSPLPVPTQPEQVTVALLKQPRGAMRHVRSTWVGDYAFGAERVTVPRGTVFTWRFVGGVAHDVTVASGPVGFASPSLRGGRTWSFHFTKPGTYRIFCSLHPALMTQIIRVR
jgi:plastocyanin